MYLHHIIMYCRGRRANSTNKDKTKNASEMHPVVLRRSSRKHKPVTSLIKSGYVMEKKKKTKVNQ